MSESHPHRRSRPRLPRIASWRWSVLSLLVTLIVVRAEIKFILRGDNILEDSAPSEPHPHRNKVDRPTEPLALESALVARLDLTPSSNSTGEEQPSINSSPVLQFHAPSPPEEEDYDEDEDSEDDEIESDKGQGQNQGSKVTTDEGLSAAVGELLRTKEDPLQDAKTDANANAMASESGGDEIDDQNLTRHRRRLMLLRSRNILVPETTSTSILSTTSSSSTRSSVSSSSSSSRPPKEHIIYALPEQGFWARPDKKGAGKKGKGHHEGKNAKIPSTPHLDEDAAPTTSTSTPMPEVDENLGVDYRQNEYNISPNPTSTESSNFYYPTQNDFMTPEASPLYQEGPPTPQFLTTPQPTTTSTEPSTTTTTPTPTTSTSTPSPAETLRMTLAEKKFHLGQCMRYCMDAIL